ncbi:MAG: hypothetical protein JNM36_01150 [Chitinophagales bacterium]|nr:hypothetical protein [Chitinophagales bacterium]
MTLAEYYPQYFEDYCQQFGKKYAEQLSPIDIECHLTQVFLKFNDIEASKKSLAYLWTMCNNKLMEVLRKPVYKYDLDQMVHFLNNESANSPSSITSRFKEQQPNELQKERWKAYDNAWKYLCDDCYAVLEAHKLNGVELKELWEKKEKYPAVWDKINCPSYEALGKKQQRCFSELKEIANKLLQNPLSIISKNKKCQ